MKKCILLLFITVSFGLVSCEKEKVESCECTEDGNEIVDNYTSEENCEHYFDIWKALLLKRNNISEEFYKAHFTILNKGLNNYNDGTSFRVQYEYKQDWVRFTKSDKFIIQINKDVSLYPHIKVNRGDLLSPDEIEKVIAGYGFYSTISVLNPDAPLIFKSQKETIEAVEKELSILKINANSYKLYDFGPATKPDGTIFLQFSKTIDYDKNRCLFGEINLTSGKITSKIDACYVQ